MTIVELERNGFIYGYFWQLGNCRGYVRKYVDSETRNDMDFSEGYF
jgi:hypothetical protein